MRSLPPNITLDVDEGYESSIRGEFNPVRAREAIRSGAERAIRRAATETFGLLQLTPPFELVARFRATAEHPPSIARNWHPASVAAVMNMPFNMEPLPGDDSSRSTV